MVFSIAVLASGTGTNFARLVEAARNGEIPAAQIACLIADRQASVLERAKRLKVPGYLLEPKGFSSRELWAQAILEKLKSHQVELVCLAGFLRKIEEPILSQYKNRILNIHPALLPKYGGAGMYGQAAHEAVLANRESETGVTVHVVDALYDHGSIIWQEKIPVLSQDTPESLAKRVHELEYKVYPRAVAMYLEKLGYEGMRV